MCIRDRVKTVQVMDGEELSKCVSKPCITAADECYNCEWSTELYVPQAFAEYVKAWFACKLLAKELELGDPDGFVFNMSVGYDLKMCIRDSPTATARMSRTARSWWWTRRPPPWCGVSSPCAPPGMDPARSPGC